MTQRTPPQAKIDDKAWPVRILIVVPGGGFRGRREELYAWLNDNIGRPEFAEHSAGRGMDQSGPHDRVAFYFRHPSPAAAFLEAFPELSLSDGTESPTYRSPHIPSGRRSLQER